MKKAKIMLMAIAVLAVLGGTLASKTHTFGSKLFYACTTVDNKMGITWYGCTRPIITTITTFNPTTVINISTSKSTFSTTVPCTVTATIGPAVPPCPLKVRLDFDN